MYNIISFICTYTVKYLQNIIDLIKLYTASLLLDYSDINT